MNDNNDTQPGAISLAKPMTLESARLMLVTESAKSARSFLEYMTMSRLYFAEYTIRSISNEVGVLGLGLTAEALEDVGLTIVGYNKLPIGKSDGGDIVFEVGFLVKRKDSLVGA